MADDKIRSGDPEKRKKKPVAKPPVDDDEEEERPRKKKRPTDDEDIVDEDRLRKKKRPADDEDEETPKKKKRKRDDDDDDNETSGALSALSAILPVGGSVFGLLSLWVGVLSVILGLVALGTLFDVFTVAGFKIPPIATCFMPIFWPISLLSGVLSFFTQKHKASYGSIAGNMRAVIGIVLSLAALVLQGILIFLYFKG
jgi:hypothetical protein